VTEIFSATLNEPEMQIFAARLAPLLKPRDCVTLYGDLGAGKSTFVRAAIQALTKAEEVPSPTFTLVQTYEGKTGPVWHFDLYRLKKSAEVLELGWEEAASEGIVFVEWPERLESLLPKSALSVHIDFVEEAARRRLRLEGSETWGKRLSPTLPMK
jgi:tRNA threonylcarbamoyladenosine biosynthesis protein TsaE